MPIHVSARLGYPGAQIPGTQSNLIRYGISTGGSVNNSVALVDAKIVRAFNTVWPTSWAGTQTASNLNASSKIPFVFSAKSGNADGTGGDGQDATKIFPTLDTTFRDNMRATLKGAPSVGVPNYFCWHHEPYGDGTLTAAQWVQGMKNIASDVMVNVNAARGVNDKWILCPIMNGFPAAQNAFDNYFPPSLYTYCAGLGVPLLAGIDCYGHLKSDGTLDPAQQPPNDQFHKAHDWAKGRGVAWAVPEIGAMVGGVATDTQDADELFVMQAMKAAIDSWPASEWPVFVCWFNGNSSTITNKTNANTFWKNLCDTGAGN